MRTWHNLSTAAAGRAKSIHPPFIASSSNPILPLVAEGIAFP
jgi:hypothetical protein